MPRRRLLHGAVALGVAAILRPTPVCAEAGDDDERLGPFGPWSTPVNLLIRISVARRDLDRGARCGSRSFGVMDYPSPQSGLANRRKDNQMRRRWDPRPRKQGPPAPDSKPTHQAEHSATSAAKLICRSTGVRDWVLDASHRPNRWALDGSPVHCHPTLAHCWAPDPRQRALSSISPDQRALLRERLERVYRRAPIRERAT